VKGNSKVPLDAKPEIFEIFYIPKVIMVKISFLNANTSIVQRLSHRLGNLFV